MNVFDREFLQTAINTTTRILLNTLQFAKQNDKKIYLAFSGGKDSLVLNHLASQVIGQENYILTHNLTGFDYPSTYQFLVENYNWNGREGNSQKQVLHVAKPKHYFFEELKKKRILPTVSVRWCCDECKHRNNIENERNNIVLLGVRGAESRARSMRYDWFNLNVGKKKIKYKCIRDVDTERKNSVLQVAPLLHWADDDIWNYIDLHKIELPQGYGDHSGRLGCQLCPLQHKSSLFTEWLSDSPFVKTYKKVMQEILDGKYGTPTNDFISPDIWAMCVWFLDSRKHGSIGNSAIIEKYKTELLADPWCLIRNDAWFKKLQAQGKIKI